jgi:hypothetical protein
MSRRSLATRFATSALLVSFGSVASYGIVTESNSATAQPQQIDIDAAERTARNYAAEQLGVAPENIALSNGRLVNLDRLGRSLVRFKVVGSDKPFGIDIDSVSGVPVDGTLLVKQEASQALSATGKLGEALRERLRAPGVTRVPLVLWLNAPTNDTAAPLKESVTRESPALTDAAIEAILARAIEQRASETAAVRTSVLELLRSVDPRAFTDDASPIAYATVPVGFVATLQASRDVVDIDLDDDRVHPDLSNATRVIRAEPDVHVNLGIVATSEKVGQVEAGSDKKIATHDCLDQITQSGTSDDSHATGVAGVMICHFDGISHGADLRLGSGSSQSSLESAAGTIRSWSAKAFNMSYGIGSGLAPSSHDKFYDDYFSTYFRTVVKSAGNQGGAGCAAGTNGDVTHPGLGYNVLTVGNLNDQNTLGRGDDAMAGCSSWRDPSSTNSDRDKPEVAAPGTSISVPNLANGFASQSGTSFAAPMVTGTATLMMSANTTLRTWPELVKAAIMATAHSNVEGDQRLSEFDGVGAIDARDAVDVVRSGGPSNSDYRGDPVTCSSFPYNYSFSLVAGRRSRLVVVWHQDPTYSSYSTQPAADLDLDILDPNGNFVLTSNSYDNTYEIVDFVPSLSGTYSARVTNQRCDKSPKYIGVAWWREP